MSLQTQLNSFVLRVAEEFNTVNFASVVAASTRACA